MSDLWDAVWGRARARQHTVVVGAVDIPPSPDDLLVLWVHCNAPWSTGGPLDEVRHRVHKLLGENLLHAEPGPGPQKVGLRSYLFDEAPLRAIDARLVEACNRLANWTEGQVVLGLDAIDAADVVTLETLSQILGHPGWLRLPMILSMSNVPEGPVAELINVVQRTAGIEAVVELASGDVSDQPSTPFEWTTLPPDVLRVLRAGAMLGSGFETSQIARLLDESVGHVLEMLQRAADAGVVLTDRGDGRFLLPPESVQTLQDQMLPSLREHWHERLGVILSESSSQGLEREREIVGQTAAPDDRIHHTLEGVEAVGNQTESEVQDTIASRAASSPPDRYAEVFEPASSVDEAPAPWEPEEPEATRAATDPAVMSEPRIYDHRTPPPPPADQARAASHFQAAGQTEAAIEQYLAAACEIAAQGDTRRSYAIIRQALKLLEGLPPAERRAQLRARLLIELGREQWQSSVLGSPFTLQEARTSLEMARAELPETAPPEVLGELASVTAGVCYDQGDLTSLQHALNELTMVSRQLLEAGESMLAARLLTDQAAVYVRLGDPVRATHLLSEAKGLFESILRVSPDDAGALEEMAAAEHLLARLALHTPIRPGRENDAYAISLDHALAAASGYEHLRQPWAVARVLETIGRLELGRRRPEAARDRLMTALQRQKQMGDVTGLARTTAALADLCIMVDRLNEAATLLADSIALNFEKGSPIGLAFNRRAVEQLKRAAESACNEPSKHVLHLLTEIEHRLVQAETVLGQLRLPGEGDAQS